MKIGTRLLFSVYIGFVVASVVHCIYGPSGMLAYTKIEGEAAKLEANLDELKGIYHDLSVEFDSLRRSGEQVALKARDLGYLYENEGIIDVANIWHPSSGYYAVGRIVGPGRFDSDNRHFSFIAGILAMTAVFLMLGNIFRGEANGRGRSLRAVSAE